MPGVSHIGIVANCCATYWLFPSLDIVENDPFFQLPIDVLLERFRVQLGNAWRANGRRGSAAIWFLESLGRKELWTR